MISDIVNYVVMNDDEEFIVVTTLKLARVLGKLIGRLKHVEIYVFKENYPEENALKLIIHNIPDQVIDCDPNNRLFYVKKLIEASHVKGLNCRDIV